MIRTLAKLSIPLFSFFCLVSAARGDQYFAYPSAYIQRDMPESPRWLSGGGGDDGYLTVTTQITSDKPCSALGDKGGIFNIGQQKMQVVVTLASQGFKSALDGVEIPIATFDGRTGPENCYMISALPQAVIPYALLESYAPGDNTQRVLRAKVKSTTDSSLNLVASAQSVLGLATAFTTGGAATTVAGLTTLAAKPALQYFENQFNAQKGNVTDGKSDIGLTWDQIRNGISSFTVPVHMGIARSYVTKSDETTADAIARYGREGDDKENRLFDLVISVTYTKSIFDPTIYKSDDWPHRDVISANYVMNYPKAAPGTQNLLKTLGGESPSLLKQASGATGANLTAVCNSAVTLLKKIGLNAIDRAVALKSFIDEANNGVNWYTVKNFKSCFGEDGSPLASNIMKIYGSPISPPAPESRSQELLGGIGDNYKDWRSKVAPVIAGFARSMEAPDTSRSAVLLRYNGNSDISFESFGHNDAWAGIETTSSPMANAMAVAPIPATAQTGSQATELKSAPILLDGKQAYPGIAILSRKAVTASHCFAYEENYDPAAPAGFVILQGTDTADLWLAKLYFSTKGTARISSVEVSKLDSSTRSFFKEAHNNVGFAEGCEQFLKDKKII